jgi:hypothetical protein
MSLITKKLITEREPATYKLDRSTVELVKFYSEFIGSPQEHVVNQALLYVFRKDKEFSAWLKANNKPAILRKTKPSEPKPNGGTHEGSHVAALGNGKRA